MNLSGGTISGNSASEVGGGISLSGTVSSSGDRLNMTGGTIDNNSAGATGGGIFIQAGEGSFGSATISAGYITNNSTTGEGLTNKSFGGGIYVNGSTTIVDAGGSVHKIKNGELHLTNAIISGNYSIYSGGGYAACPTSTSKIKVDDGAAIYNNNASFNGSRDIFIYGDDDDYGVHSGRPEYEIDERMLGGAPYNWKKTMES